MDDGNSWIGFLLMAGALVLFSVLYGFGAAVQALNTSALEDNRDEGDKKAEKLLQIQENPYLFIRTNQLVTSLLTLTLGAFSMAWVVRQCKGLFARVPSLPPALTVTAAYVLALILMAFFLTCIGIVIPKRMAGKSPARFCYRTLPLVLVLMKFLFPITWVVDGVSYGILKLMGIDIHARDDKVTEEDIMYMVNEGHDQGVLEASEAEMITNIFEFDDKVASDIMTHRKSVVALDGEMPFREAVDFILNESNNSRFPVYEEDIDNMIGILNLRDVFSFAEAQHMPDKPLKQMEGLLREAYFIPEKKNINALFQEMQSGKIHMAIVIDEYGQTAGIVTMEDILEEIVGNIMDEYDEEEPDIVVRENGSFQLSGMTSLEDVEDALGMEFEEDDRNNFDTLNGFLISRLGHLPEEDEKAHVEAGGYRFSIVKAENKVIGTVMATKTEPRPEPAESE